MGVPRLLWPGDMPGDMPTCLACSRKPFRTTEVHSRALPPPFFLSLGGICSSC